MIEDLDPAAGNHLWVGLNREYVEGLADAGLNCTLHAAVVTWNDGARADNAKRLYDAYVRECRERGERVAAFYEVGIDAGEWLLCLTRMPGEGPIRVGLSDEITPEEGVVTVRVCHLRDALQ